VQLLSMGIYEVKRTKPKDQYVELEDYKRTRGDPSANGHSIEIAPNGTKLVKVGSTGLREKGESMIYQAVKMQVFDNGEDPLMQMTQKGRFGQMIENIGGKEMAVTDSFGGSSGSHDSGTPSRPEDAQPPGISTKVEVTGFSFSGATVKSERPAADALAQPKAAKVVGGSILRVASASCPVPVRACSGRRPFAA
jgi:hypothetical protein